MIPVDATIDTIINKVVGGFAAVAAEPKTVTPELLTFEIGQAEKVAISEEKEVQSSSAVANKNIATKTAGCSSLAATALSISGAIMMPSIVASLTSCATGNYLVSGIFRNAYETIKCYVSGKGRPLTEEEFVVTLKCHGLIDKLRQALKKYAQQKHMTENELYSVTLDTIYQNPAYRNISEEHKIKLAVCLTDGLV